jgi:dihydroneopterin aldolase
MTASAPDIAASWDVTSDSLAAWLACRLGARRLVLVKRIGLNGVRRADELGAAGVIDPTLPALLRAAMSRPGGLEAEIVGEEELAGAGEAFARSTAVGTRIEWHRAAVRTPSSWGN